MLNVVKEENAPDSCSTTRWSKHISLIKTREMDPVLMSYRTNCYQAIGRVDKFLRFVQVEKRFTFEANSLVEMGALQLSQLGFVGCGCPGFVTAVTSDGCLLPLCVRCATFQAVGFFADC